MKRITPQRAALTVMAVLVTSLLSRRTAFFSPQGRIGRRALLKLGGLGLTALATSAWKGRTSVARLPSGSPSRAVSCVLTPEHRPGTPLMLRLTVVDATTCRPLKGAAVDLWHCDAEGIYAGFVSASTGGAPGGNAGPTDKQTFLRGIQRTDARGYCEFQTIYPGWYRGRTTHIHVKVHVGGSVVHTGQLYFPDNLTGKVYQTGPYKARAAARDTRNSDDAIYRNGGPQSMLTMKPTGHRGYAGTITLGVRRS